VSRSFVKVSAWSDRQGLRKGDMSQNREECTGAGMNQSGVTNSLVALVGAMARSLVDVPESVCVHAKTRDGAVCIQVFVDTGDVGKIIGKQGRTARSLRTILGAASMKMKVRFSLDIVEGSHKNATVG
jgi:predicted RNA-binding protein YlqC (UPF0109 family)